MAVTLFHKVINNITIINKGSKDDKSTKIEPHKISSKIKLNRHRMSEVKTYD